MENALIEKLDLGASLYIVRGHRVLLDFDLALLYQVETKALKRAVRRNEARFPADFMFELTAEEWEILRCQIGTSRWGGSRYLPFAFTEQGVGMLSSVLSSDKAIQVHIQIMRAFVRIREILSENRDIAKRIDALEGKYDAQFEQVFVAFRQLLKEERAPIGFKWKNPDMAGFWTTETV